MTLALVLGTPYARSSLKKVLSASSFELMALSYMKSCTTDASAHFPCGGNHHQRQRGTLAKSVIKPSGTRTGTPSEVVNEIGSSVLNLYPFTSSKRKNSSVNFLSSLSQQGHTQLQSRVVRHGVKLSQSSTRAGRKSSTPPRRSGRKFSRS